jgi:hypothetical protein
MDVSFMLTHRWALEDGLLLSVTPSFARHFVPPAFSRQVKKCIHKRSNSRSEAQLLKAI